jgi:hypothetical protein
LFRRYRLGQWTGQAQEHVLRVIAKELKLIREALERWNPPPPNEEGEDEKSVYERRGIICF